MFSEYIKGVIAMSGTGISSNAVDYAPKETSQFISKASKCTGLTPLKTVRCLQMAESKSIFQADKALEVSFITRNIVKYEFFSILLFL